MGHDQRSCWSMNPLREKFIRGLAIRGRADRTSKPIPPSWPIWLATTIALPTRSPTRRSRSGVTVDGLVASAIWTRCHLLPAQARTAKIVTSVKVVLMLSGTGQRQRSAIGGSRSEA